ncbi:MAG TPA: energy transducer TonB [Gammaproteobacteria bacterium]|nr:energy transducer TonB [Gammaproteobacteria bacterium]
MHSVVHKYPFRVGVTSSLAMHIAGALIATYILVYEPPPLDLSQFKPVTAVPVLLDKPKPRQIKPELRPKPQDSLKKAAETLPPEEPPPPLESIEYAPSPSYMALVKGMLEANKRYPRRALERGDQGVVVLWFVLDRYGQVMNYRIEQSSGSPILDGEVVRLIKKVGKFPMMPDDLARDSIELTIPIRFVLIDDPKKARKE